MPKTAPKKPRMVVLVLAGGVATLFAMLLAEAALRLFVPTELGRVLGTIGYADESGAPVADLQEAAKRGLVVPVPGKTPRRGRYMFAPDLTFYITYDDNDVLQRDWLDEQGRVINRMNSLGVREREELTKPKPAGQRRIVCIGDSFTFGWGIPAEQTWARLLETELRTDGLDVRTVNCGASGTVCTDEYVNGLVQRFHVFEPDAVIMTICLNDLFGSDGVTVIGPPPDSGSRLLDLCRGVLGDGPLDLASDRDWVGELLAMKQFAADGTPNPRFGPDKPFDAMWPQGVPQRSIREGKAWCDARDIPFLVVIWPFLQGLGPDRHYPFQKMHTLVAADCREAGVPLLDTLPSLRQTPQEDLWVTPADPHPNPLAQRLALPELATFVRKHTGW